MGDKHCGGGHRVFMLAQVTYDKVRPVVDAALSHATEEIPVATVLVLADAIDRFVGALHTRDAVSAERTVAS